MDTTLRTALQAAALRQAAIAEAQYAADPYIPPADVDGFVFGHHCGGRCVECSFDDEPRIDDEPHDTYARW